MLHPVIMAGGSGSRLWPLSRQLNPKQFLCLTDTQTSMLQATVQRLEGLDHGLPLIICNEEHRFLAAEQLRQIGKEGVQILLEPAARNTAPALALAALRLTADGDLLIDNIVAFHSSIKIAMALAEAGKLVTFGVVPTIAETGYGYLQKGGALSESSFKVRRFVEKPDTENALLGLRRLSVE